jgi:hypothetical protein
MRQLGKAIVGEQKFIRGLLVDVPQDRFDVD